MRLPFWMASASVPNWFTAPEADRKRLPAHWLTTKVLAFLLLSMLLNQVAQGAEATQGMKITGDQESPQVLYIIPWKEQPVSQPEQPKLREQILEPLTPCDLDQQITQFLPKLWNCVSIDSDKRP